MAGQVAFEAPYPGSSPGPRADALTSNDYDERAETMSVTTTADEAVARAREHIEKAREEIGAVLVERRTMWGADEFRPGHIRNLFDRLDALLRAADGDDIEWDARCARIEAP